MHYKTDSSSTFSFTCDIQADVGRCVFYDLQNQKKGRSVTQGDAPRQRLELNGEELNLANIPNNKKSPLFRTSLPDLSENLLYDSFCLVYTKEPRRPTPSWQVFYPDYQKGKWEQIPISYFDGLAQALRGCTPADLDKTKKQQIASILHEKDHSELCYQVLCGKINYLLLDNKLLASYLCANINQAFYAPAAEFQNHIFKTYKQKTDVFKRSLAIDTSSTPVTITSHVIYSGITEEEQALDTEHKSLLSRHLIEAEKKVFHSETDRLERESMLDRIHSIQYQLAFAFIPEESDLYSQLHIELQALIEAEKKLKKDIQVELVEKQVAITCALRKEKNEQAQNTPDYDALFELEINAYEKTLGLLVELTKSNPNDADIVAKTQSMLEKLFSLSNVNSFPKIKALFIAMTHALYVQFRPQIKAVEKQLDDLESGDIDRKQTLFQQYQKLNALRSALKAFFEDTVDIKSDRSIIELAHTYIALAAKLPKLISHTKEAFDLTTSYELHRADDHFKTKIGTNRLSIKEEALLDHPAFRPLYILANLNNVQALGDCRVLDFYHALNEPGFNKLTPGEKNIFLNLFINKLNGSRESYPLPHLILTNCSDLDNRLFKKLLKAMTKTAIAPGLTHLTLINAPLLDHDAIEAIQTHCGSSLTHLHLEALKPATTTIQTSYSHNARKFPQLASITLKKLPHLTTVKLDSPLLSTFTVEDCPRLTVVRLSAEESEIPASNKAFCNLVVLDDDDAYRDAIGPLSELTKIKTLSTLYAMIAYAQSGNEETTARRTTRVLPLIVQGANISTLLGRHCIYALEKLKPTAIFEMRQELFTNNREDEFDDLIAALSHCACECLDLSKLSLEKKHIQLLYTAIKKQGENRFKFFVTPEQDAILQEIKKSVASNSHAFFSAQSPQGDQPAPSSQARTASFD